MFPDISDRIVDVDDEEYFDEYCTEHHRVNSEGFVKSLGKQGEDNRSKDSAYFSRPKNMFRVVLRPRPRFKGRQMTVSVAFSEFAENLTKVIIILFIMSFTNLILANLYG